MAEDSLVGAEVRNGQDAACGRLPGNTAPQCLPYELMQGLGSMRTAGAHPSGHVDDAHADPGDQILPHDALPIQVAVEVQHRDHRVVEVTT